MIAYKQDWNDTVIMEIPATNPLTVTTVLAPNHSFSGVAKRPFKKVSFFSKVKRITSYWDALTWHFFLRLRCELGKEPLK